jgi:hypothetical protein
MFSWTNWTVVAVAGVLLICGSAAAQNLPTSRLPPSSRPPVPADAGLGQSDFTDPIFLPDRRGSSVETLEQLTGEPTADSRRERGGEGERDEIESDRDSFTPATTIAGRRRLIVESAYSFLDNRGFKETHSFPETILRFGLTDRVELRLGWNAEIGGGSSEISGAAGEGDPFARQGKVEREYTLSYGAKFRITDQDRWLPRSVVIVQGFTPTGGSPGTSTATALIATYAAGWVFPNRWQFDGALRYGFDSERGDRFNEWTPCAVLRVPLGEKLAVHAEYFGIFTTGKEANIVRHYFSPGMRYLVTPNLEVGVRVGWGLNDQSARFFSNLGFGWRF